MQVYHRKEGKVNMEDKVQTLHYLIKEMFPDAVSVEVFVNSEGIDVTPVFKTNLVNKSIKNISGNWIKKA
jgi:hypothetical protein